MGALDNVPPMFVNVLVGVGGLCILRIVAYFLISFYETFLRPGKDLKQYGEWALVTGATDGIGKAMAYELGKKGMNVMLISRTESKLVDTESELRSKCPDITVQHLAIDYSAFDVVAQAKVGAAIADKDVGVLVNNVGVSYAFPKYFDELTEDEMSNLIELNVHSTLKMTRIVLPAMLERKRGAIVNFASGAATMSSPLLAGYAAAKAFVVKLSEAMNVEMAPKGVHVQCQAPLMVATKLSKVRKPSWDKPSPAAYAKAGVAAIGHGAVVSPYWSHKLQLWVAGLVPGTEQIVFNMHKSLRARALKKLSNKKD